MVYDVAGSSHVSFRVGVEYGGIHALDGVAKHFEHRMFVGELWYHVGGIDACKRLVVGVFKQT